MKDGHAPRFTEKTAIKYINGQEDCDIIEAGLCEIRVKSIVVAWSQCIERTGKRVHTK